MSVSAIPYTKNPLDAKGLLVFWYVLGSLALLETLTQGAEVRGRNLHTLVSTSDRVEHALALQVDLPGATSVTQGVAASVTKRSLFTGFDTDTTHN
jgi:hypothetical protein